MHVKTIGFENAKLLVYGSFTEPYPLIVEGQRFGRFEDAEGKYANTITWRDLEGRRVLSGLVDLQVNGGGGVLFNDDISIETLDTIGRAHAQFGTCAFLPTLITASDSDMVLAAEAVAEARLAGVPGILGLHLEGPYISAQKAGIHDPAAIRPIDRQLIRKIVDIDPGVLLITLAPESVSLADIDYLTRMGAIVWCGHSNADYETTMRAMGAGVSGVTHLFNAMSPLESRAPGVVGAALANDSVYVGLISDGHHVHPASIKVAISAKPHDRVILVTDSMSVTSTHADSFEYLGQKVSVDKYGRCLDAQGRIAGAKLGMSEALTNTQRFTRQPLESVADYATVNPLAAIGLDTTRMGSLLPGYAASFVVLNDDDTVYQTWIDGALRYDSTSQNRGQSRVRA